MEVIHRVHTFNILREARIIGGMEIRKVMRYNKSLVICIPPQFAAHLGIQRGDYVVIYLGPEGAMRVGRVDPERLPDLLAAPAEVVDYGKSTGGH